MGETHCQWELPSAETATAVHRADGEVNAPRTVLWKMTLLEKPKHHCEPWMTQHDICHYPQSYNHNTSNMLFSPKTHEFLGMPRALLCSDSPSLHKPHPKHVLWNFQFGFL